MRSARLAVLTLVVLCTACGGGGGDAPSGPVVQPPVGSTTSGLLPAAANPGAIVADDPTRLEPVQDGSTRQFRGTHVAGPGATPVRYENRWTQQLRSDGKVVESESNPLNEGPASEEYSLVSGQLVSTATFNFSGRAPETIQTPVLRAPVRAGDQYTLLDKRYTDTDIDQDRDTRTDTLDVAFYLRVVGFEDIELPDLGRVRTVRVELVLLQRVLLSSNGSYSPVFRTATIAWVVEGIGLVRRRLESTLASGAGEETYDEWLVAWDGVTTGLGRMPVETPAPGLVVGAFENYTVPQAHVFAEHVLLFGRAEVAPFDRKATLAIAYDQRGKALRSTLAQWDDLDRRITQAVPVRDGLVVLATPGSGDTTLVGLGATDRFGARLGSGTMSTFDLKGTRVIVQITGGLRLVGDDTRAWLVWGRTFRDPSDPAFGFRYELVAQVLSQQGSPLGGEITLQLPAPPSQLSAAARGGRLLLTWLDTRSGARLEAGSVSLGQTSIARSSLYAEALPRQPYQIVPVQLDSGGAVLWWTDGVPPAPPSISGLQLGQNLEPVQIGSGPQATALQSVPTAHLTARQSATFFGSAGNRLVLTGADAPPASTPPVLRVAWIDTTLDMLLALAPLRAVGVPMTGFEPQAMATLPDRVILFAGTSSSVVWLRTPGP